jgi:hypothetical protein
MPDSKFPYKKYAFLKLASQAMLGALNFQAKVEFLF